MSVFVGLEKLTRAQAERQIIAALQFDFPAFVNVGHRRYALTFEPCRSRYPLRLHGMASGVSLQLDLDAGALMPELSARTLELTGSLAPALICDACDDWLCALEGAFGFSLDITAVSYDVTPDAGSYGLALTHMRSGRTASFSFQSEAVDRWLRRRREPLPELRALARRIVVDVPVCIAGPKLSLARLRRIRPGDALVLDRHVRYLRLPLYGGTRRALLNIQGDRFVINQPLVDEPNPAPELTSEFIPIDALVFSLDAMITSLRMSLDELSRLRRGSLVSLQMSVQERAVTLLCQGMPFARGELVNIDDVLAVRITSMVQTAHPGDAS